MPFLLTDTTLPKVSETLFKIRIDLLWISLKKAYLLIRIAINSSLIKPFSFGRKRPNVLATFLDYESLCIGRRRIILSIRLAITVYIEYDSLDYSRELTINSIAAPVQRENIIGITMIKSITSMTI